MSTSEFSDPTHGPATEEGRRAFVQAVLDLPPEGTIVDAIGTAAGPQAADAYYGNVVEKQAKAFGAEAAAGYAGNLTAAYLKGVR